MSYPDRIRVALMDDHSLFREALKRVLESDGKIEVTAEASTLSGSLSLCKSGTSFDIALIDFQLATEGEDGNGLRVLQELRDSRPNTKCIVLTGGLPPHAFVRVVKYHRAGLFLKSEPASELLLAIEKTMRGELWISPKAAFDSLQADDTPSQDEKDPSTQFNQRDRLVLRLITEGMANKEIATHLNTTESNVKAILQKIFEKTGVRTRSQLVRHVFEFNVDLS